jgi:hypothetical protein
MSAALWIGSLVYLAAVSGWVTAAAREGAPGVEDEGGSTLRRTVSFALMVIAATAVFGLIVGGIERCT